VLSLKAFDRAHIVVCDSRRILVTTEYDGDDGDDDNDDKHNNDDGDNDYDDDKGNNDDAW